MPAPPGTETYDGRLDTFRSAVPTAKRGPGTSKARKPVAWPHETPEPSQLARAGFFFRPTPTYLDNVACFLCNKSLDGWDKDDDPISEHLYHSKDCGFALLAAIESKFDLKDRAKIHPMGKEMYAARKSTFRDDWPHEHKKAWRPKVDKMAEAGWHYSPTPESDDYVACAYCGLALDGWESDDDPLEEHRRRAVECTFFSTAPIEAEIAYPKLANKKGRASKVSRASTQSSSSNWMVLAPDSSIVDGDSFLSVASTTSMAQNAPKGRKGKTAPTRGARGGAASKHMTEIEPEDSDFSIKVDDMPPPPPPKAKRGRKRSSQEMEVDSVTEGEAPPRAQKAARTRGNSVAESVAPTTESETEQLAGLNKPARKRTSKAKTCRASNAKTRVVSAASVASLRMASPDQEALERDLEAELDSSIVMPEGLSQAKAASKKNDNKQASAAPSRVAVPSSNVPEEEAEEESLRPARGKKEKAGKTKATKKAQKVDQDQPTSPALRAATEMLTRGASPIATLLPTKGRPKRVISKQSIKQQQPRDIRISAIYIPESSIVAATNGDAEDGPADETDVSSSSQDTVKNKRRGKTAETREEDDAMTIDEPEVSHPTIEAPQEEKAKTQSKQTTITKPKSSTAAATTKKGPAKRQKHIATPSPSPQSSDAENQPPSSRPSALVSRTPNVPTTSPLRCDVVNAAATTLKSSQIWTALDLETVFARSPDKENARKQTDTLDLAAGTLTSPEKRMTVTEWQMYQANIREESLRAECERIVGVWELHGNRALRTLEGIEVSGP